MQRHRLATIGFNTALVGLVVALLSFVPAIGGTGPLPWPLFVGSAIYLAGGICLALNARGEAGKKAMVRLRVVRLGFVAVFFLLLQRIVAS